MLGPRGRLMNQEAFSAIWPPAMPPPPRIRTNVRRRDDTRHVSFMDIMLRIICLPFLNIISHVPGRPVQMGRRGSHLLCALDISCRGLCAIARAHPRQPVNTAGPMVPADRARGAHKVSPIILLSHPAVDSHTTTTQARERSIPPTACPLPRADNQAGRLSHHAPYQACPQAL